MHKNNAIKDKMSNKSTNGLKSPKSTFPGPAHVMICELHASNFSFALAKAKDKRHATNGLSVL